MLSLLHDTPRHNISRFELCCAGRKPHLVKTFEQLQGICEALVIVETATDDSFCMPCDANPYNLLCHCKGGRKIGVCYHILLTTHLIMKAGQKSEQKAINNLNYMVGKIDGAKKGSGQPKSVKHCLVREDSSDDEEEPVLNLIKW
jgi:hypothetical protein